MTRRFLLNKQEAKLMGVAAGLADMTGIDALAFRLALILGVLVTGPVAVILYVAAGLLAAESGTAVSAAQGAENEEIRA